MPRASPSTWSCETAAPQALRLIGWGKTISVAPGDVVTVRMYVAKNGNPAGRLNKIILADGSELHDTQLGGDAGGKSRYDPDANQHAANRKVTRRQTCAIRILASTVVAALALLVGVTRSGRTRAQGGRRVPEGFISEGDPEDAEPTGPRAETGSVRRVGRPGHHQQARSRAADDARGRGGRSSNARPTAPPRTSGSKDGPPGASNDPFITCDPLGFPRNLIAHAITSRGGTLFGSAPDRILIAYEQQRVWREIWMDGRALPKAVDVRGAPESRYYGYSVGHWENDNTLVIDTTGLDERAWLDEAGHPHSSMAHIQERYTRSTNTTSS